jgi:hypothetical protein
MVIARTPPPYVPKVADVALKRAHEMVSISCPAEPVRVVRFELFCTSDGIVQVTCVQDRERILRVLPVTLRVPHSYTDYPSLPWQATPLPVKVGAPHDWQGFF